MSERDALRLAARRAALHASVRDGDAGAAARAAARLRIPGARLSAREIAVAHDTRIALGRALVVARLPRPQPLPVPAPAVRASRRLPLKRVAVIAAVLFGLIFLVLGPGGAPGGKPEGEASAVVPDVTRPQILAQVSRGRSAATTAPEIVAAAEPSAAPTPAPTEAPSAAPSAGAGGSGGAGGSASGAGGGGGGIGIGTGPGLITLPTPLPTTTPRVPPPGYGRLTIIALDARTFRPVPDTCVSFGSLSCTAIMAGNTTALSYRTDENGRWSLDVPLGAPTVSYDMLFFKLGYRVVTANVTLRRGGSVVKTVFLVKTG
jgi:hypothetical protein